MTTEQLLQDLRSFFFKVNSFRTQIMRKENPNEIYDQFPQDEPMELIIHKGMSQYEDLAKYFKKKIDVLLQFINQNLSHNQNQNLNPSLEQFLIINQK